jgi:hypothetical protein
MPCLHDLAQAYKGAGPLSPPMKRNAATISLRIILHFQDNPDFIPESPFYAHEQKNNNVPVCLTGIDSPLLGSLLNQP